MNRTAIREQTFKLVYSLEIQKQENLEEAIQLYEETNTIIDEKAKEYLVDAIFGIAKNKEEITKQIETNLKAEWKLERISKIDLAILKLAIYELKYTDTPSIVAINEAIELSKRYSDEAVTKMINGVLDNIYHSEENNG